MANKMGYGVAVKWTMIAFMLAALGLVSIQLPVSENGRPLVETGGWVHLATVISLGVSGATIRMLVGGNVVDIVRGLHEPGKPMAALFQIIIGALAAIVVYSFLADRWLASFISGISPVNTVDPKTISGIIFTGLFGGLAAPDIFNRFIKGK